MPVMEYLERNARLYTDEIALVELNPDDVTHDYIMGLASNGVNRISMGVQSFVDSELSLVNRRHDSRGAINALETIKNAGITNISIDLIFGIPGQTLDSWKKSIDVAIGLSPTHISCYNLSYEEGTKLWRMRESGEVKELDESTILEMYNILINALKDAGYSHYEISNYCKPGCHSRHNSSYWDYTPYVGLGASAHSFDGNVRSYNPASVKEYIAALKIGNLPGVVEPAEWWEKYDEYIMVALRTAAGVSLNEVKRLFGDKARDYLLCNSREYLEKGLLVNDNGFLSIPEHHFMLSDAIIRDLMWDD